MVDRQVGLLRYFVLCGALDQAGIDPVKDPRSLQIFRSGLREVQIQFLYSFVFYQIFPPSISPASLCVCDLDTSSKCITSDKLILRVTIMLKAQSHYKVAQQI